ncbi:MAG: hypothetical protein LBG29_03955 [Synergistaceae bacterium]|jgi:flagellin-like hook-associated protein FlgL|nr:hypothetical protein [Synergistaceae bacterium]
MRINTNVMSYMAYNAVTRSTGLLAKASEKLATGLRVNSAADDAAGLAISEKMTAQIRGLDQASRNAQDGMSLLQTAEGALNEIHSMLQRMRELAIQAASDVLTAEDRDYIQLEVNELSRQITDIANQTQFNKKKLLNGDSAILWSASTSDIRVLVGGTLLKKDIFGQTTNAEGNYKITFETVQAGTGQVQKSNILYLKHGTQDTNGTTNESSGVNSFSSLNMVEGVWRVDTRAEPFGGVYYYQGDYNPSDATAVGATLEKNGVSDLAPGEYAIQLSDNVPMMATFDTTQVDDIYQSIRTDSSGDDIRGLDTFDAAFVATSGDSVTASVTGTIQSDILRGVAASLGTIDTFNTDMNVYTYYEVTGRDERDLITAELLLDTQYISPQNGAVNLNLDYRTEAGSKIDISLDYAAADDVFFYQVSDTFDTNNETLLFEFKGPGGTPFYSFDVTSYLSAGRMDMDDIKDAIMTAYSAGTPQMLSDVDIGASAIGGTSRYLEIDFTDKTNSGITMTIGGSLAATLGIGITNATTGTPPIKSSGFVVREEKSIAGLSGQNIDDIVNILNDTSGPLVGDGFHAEYNVSVNDPDKRAGTFRIVRDGGTRSIIFGGPVQGQVETELGVAGLESGGSGGITGAAIIDRLGITGEDVGDKSLQDLAGIINSSMTANGVAGFSAIGHIDTNPGYGSSKLSYLELQNNSIYKVELSDSVKGTLAELFGPSPISLDRDKEENGNRVFVDEDITIDIVPGSVASSIALQLNSAIYAMLSADQLSGTGASFSDAVPGIDFTNASSAYNIEINDDVTFGKTSIASLLWDSSTGSSVARNAATATIASNPLRTTPGNGQIKIDINSLDIASALNEINLAIAVASTDFDGVKAVWLDTATGLYYDPATNFYTDPSNGGYFNPADSTWYDPNGTALGTQPAHPDVSANGNSGPLEGKIIFINGTSNLLTIKQTSTNAADGINATGRGIFAPVGDGDIEFTMTAGQRSAQNASNTLQAKDALRLLVAWEGNEADGDDIGPGSRTVEVYEDYDNAALMNAKLAETLSTPLAGLYEHFVLNGGTTGSDFSDGDSWMMFTNAANTGGDSLNVKLSDDQTRNGQGLQSQGITYYFDDGVLDRLNSYGGTPVINQMAWAGGGPGNQYENLRHNIDIGDGILGTASSILFSYGERANGGDFDEWAMDGSNGNSTPYYAQAYYGEQTTYHIASGAGIDDVVKGVQVNKMNDVNGSLLFIYHAGSNPFFEVKTKTVSRSGGSIDEDSITINASILNGTPIILPIGGIAFDGILVDTSGLTDGDKFVINVAAAAKLDSMATPLNPSFISNENISIYADLSRSGGTGWDSKSQYRFANGAMPDGNYKGFIIDNLTGAEKSGALTLSVGTLNTASGVGDPGNPLSTGDDEAFWIRAEVNNPGRLIPGASGLVTSVYIKDLE